MSENNIFSYTNRSLEESRAEGMRKIPIISRGDWTDLNPTDPGMILLDYVHALVDMIQYYQDHNALESFLSTAKERENIFRLAKQLSYKIRSAKGSKVDVKFYVEENHEYPIYIPKDTVVYTEDNIKFLTTKDAYLGTSENPISVIVPCMQGELNIESYTGTGSSIYNTKENPSNQVYKLGRLNIDIDSIEIRDSVSDELWTPVDYIIFSGASDKVYQVVLNADGSVDIHFGDGERGRVPSTEEELIIRYTYSLAEGGRVGADTIKRIESSIYNSIGDSVEVRCNNPKSSTGGSGPQSEREIVEEAPGAVKSQDRAVTLSDFENLARLVEGVSDAKAYDINNPPEGIPMSTLQVKLLIIPELNYEVNESLKADVYNYISRRMVPSTHLEIETPESSSIDIQVSVVRNPAYPEGELEYSVETSIREYFNSRHGAVGQSFNPNELISVISTIPGVRYVNHISPKEIVTVKTFEVLKVGTIVVAIE